MAGIDDLQGSGVYDDGKGKGGESQGVSSGSSDVSSSQEAQEVEDQGFGWF